MNKKHLAIITLLVCSFLLASCVKAAKNLVEDIEDRARCIELLGDYTTNSTDNTCSQITAEIDAILRDCGEFFDQEEKDDLNAVKENCSDG